MIPTPWSIPSKEVLGSEVVNDAGEDRGKIEDLVLDLERGCVAYGVLSAGGFWGLGGKEFFAVPWQAIRPSHHDQKFILNLQQF